MSIELRVGPRETQRLRRHVAVDRKTGAGKGGRADRAFIHVLDGVANARTIAAEHFDIGHAVMTEGHWLGCLQMGEARHDRVGMFLGAIKEGGDQACQHFLAFLQFFLHPEAKIERHLVVARAGRVQTSGGRADQIAKPRLDVHVDVFKPAREFELAAFDL